MTIELKRHLWSPNPSVAMSATALEVAFAIYGEHNDGARPETIICTLEDTPRVYELMAEFPHFLLKVVPVPGLPSDTWAVAGTHGVVIDTGWR